MKRAVNRWWDLSAALLLLVVIFTSAARLALTEWTNGLEIAGILAILGVVLGMFLGKSRFHPAVSSLLAFLYSLVMIPWVVGEYTYRHLEWHERLANIAGRLAACLQLYLQKRPVEDTLLVVVILGVLFWIVSLISGYFLIRRGSFAWAVLPPGLVILIIQLYDRIPVERIWVLAVFLFVSLTLLGRLAFLQDQKRWVRNNLTVTSDSSGDLNAAFLLTAAVIVALVWIIPMPRQAVPATTRLWNRFSTTWRSTRQDLGNIFAGFEGSTDEGSIVVFSEKLNMGNNAPTGSMLVFTVQVPEQPILPRYYWRVRTYDTYQEGTWSNSFRAFRLYDPGQGSWGTASTPPQELEDFTFRIGQARIANLAMPQNAVDLNRNATLNMAPTENIGMEALLVSTNPGLSPGEQYEVHSAMSSLSILDLRNAGSDYPQWVVDRYLQLPEDISERMRSLAEDLSSQYETPYDKVMAITSYLRQEINYDLHVPSPPAGYEMLDWFIFEHREGFCNYYASAEVILLRIIGIPARLAVGYTQGDWTNQLLNIRAVRQNNAHAWPEVYFPSIGWVEFEPTASQSPLIRPLGTAAPVSTSSPDSQIPDDLAPLPEETEAAPPETTPGQEIPLSGPGVSTGWKKWVTALVVLTGLAGSAYLVWRYRPKKRLDPLPVLLVRFLETSSVPPPRWLKAWADRVSQPSIRHRFQVVYRSLRRLGSSPDPALTPAEAARDLARILPDVSASIQTLLKEYQKALFSQRPGNIHAATRSAKAIEEAAWSAIWARWLEAVKKRIYTPRRHESDKR